MLIQLLSTILLLATPAVGAGAGKINTFQNNYNDHSSITAPTPPKCAYHNPSGDYGTENNNLYYYTEENLLRFTIGPNSNQTATNPTLWVEYNVQNSAIYNYGLSASQEEATEKAQELQASYDVYLGGTLQTGYDLWVADNYQSYYYAKLNLEAIFNQSTAGERYIWIFDHQEEIPLSPNSIFDVVGDATTASAGIIGNGLNAMIALFYANNQITGFGIICLILAGIGLVWFAWRLVLALFHRRA